MGLHCDLGEIAAHSLTDWPTWVVSRDASASKKFSYCKIIFFWTPAGPTNKRQYPKVDKLMNNSASRLHRPPNKLNCAKSSRPILTWFWLRIQEVIMLVSYEQLSQWEHLFYKKLVLFNSNTWLVTWSYYQHQVSMAQWIRCIMGPASSYWYPSFKGSQWDRCWLPTSSALEATWPDREWEGGLHHRLTQSFPPSTSLHPLQWLSTSLQHSQRLQWLLQFPLPQPWKPLPWLVSQGIP